MRWRMVGKPFVGLTESKLIYEDVPFVGRMGSRISIEKRGYRELFGNFYLSLCEHTSCSYPRFRRIRSLSYNQSMFKRYRQIIIEDPNPAPTADEIQAIETVLGAKLPDDYLDFLNVGNGASMDDYIVSVPLRSVIEGMSFRFFTTYSGVQSLIKELESQRKSPYAPIPNRVLPIAEDSNGSYLYLDLRRADASPVLAFVYGLPAWTGLQQEDELVHLAANFSTYIDMLKFDADEYKELLQKAMALQNTSQIDSIMEYLDLALPNWRQQWGMV